MRRIALVPLAAALAACAAPGSVPPAAGPAGPEPSIVETSTGVTFHLRNDDTGEAHLADAPLDRVRAALPAVFQELGIAGAGFDAEGRTFGSRRITAQRVGGERASAWVRCGNEGGAGPSAATRHRVEMSVLVTLRPEGSRTWVSTLVGGAATPVEGTSTGPVMCVSRRGLESRIREMLALRLGPAVPAPRTR